MHVSVYGILSYANIHAQDENKDNSLRDSTHDKHVDVLDNAKEKIVAGDSLTTNELDQLSSISAMYPYSDKENGEQSIWSQGNTFTSVLEGALLMLDDASVGVL